MRHIPQAWVSHPHILSIPSTNFVHVWKICLNHRNLQTLADTILSVDEEVRAQNMRNIQGRTRYRACRAALRDILSQYVQGTKSVDLQFSRTKHGKPFLQQQIPSMINFNVTHTADLGLIAVSPFEVGIDIEFNARPLTNVTRLMDSRFTPNEKESVIKASTNTDVSLESHTNILHRNFLLMWTRKEAFLKCSGEGIKRGLKSFEVEDFLHSPRLASVDSSSEKALQWVLANVDVDNQHFASLAFQSKKEVPVTLYNYE